MAGMAEILARMKALKGLVKEATPAATEELAKVVRKELASGLSPASGLPWQPTKEGKRPLQNAAGALRATPVGKTILLKITGHHFFHHAGKGAPQRLQLPETLRAPHEQAITKALVEAFNAKVKK